MPSTLKKKVSKLFQHFPLKALCLTLILTPLSHADFIADASADSFVAKARASHFLSQASMGGRVDEIDALALRIEAIGYLEACEEWIDAQLLTPRGETFLTSSNQMMSVDSVAYTGNGSRWHWDYGWWHQALSAQDQLRQRMAFALSQIAVVSTNYWQGLYRSRYLSHVKYYDRLAEVSFTSHRNFLTNITYSPMMGVWLSHAQNSPGDPENGIFPDENYAREILQLFSMGVYAQRPNGEYIYDFNNNPIENYNNDHIRNFAKVFTGLSIDDQRDFHAKNLTLIRDYPLKMLNAYHDVTEKHLLNDTVLPAGQGGNTDITQALDNIAYHKSTAPNFSRLLIKRFTSSNPSPEYIKRVTDAWYQLGDYAGDEEGDFKAVIKAILLDPEARHAISYVSENGVIKAVLANPLSAKIKEPILKMTQFLRFANPETTGPSDGRFRIAAAARPYGQPILGATTVFNYYDADFAPASGPLGQYSKDEQDADPYALSIENVAPEAQILSQNIVSEYKQFYNMISSGSGLNYIQNGIPYETALKQIDAIKAGLFTTEDDLLRHLDVYLCHGQLPSEVHAAFKANLDTNAGTNADNLSHVLSILFSSPAYSISN